MKNFARFTSARALVAGASHRPAGNSLFRWIRVGVGAVGALYCLTHGASHFALSEQQEKRPAINKMGPINTMDVFLDIPETRLASPNKFTVTLDELEDKQLTFLIHHPEGPKIGATGAVCTYDYKTDLSKGLLVNDKLICPEHGCEFNAFTGSVEHGPAMNGLAAFHVDRIDVDGVPKLRINLPLRSPAAVMPPMAGKNPDDFRKVMIIGCGGGGVGCAETLRKIGFGGEITMFCESKYGPIQRRNLTKFTTFEGNESQILIRNPEFWKEVSIDVMPRSQVKKVIVNDGYGSLELTNSSKYYFDALLIASGLKRPSLKIQKTPLNNYIDLSSLESFLQAQKLLQWGTSVVINGVTLQSLELASTLLRERPGLSIHMVNRPIDQRTPEALGTEVYKAILKGLAEKGVKIYNKKAISGVEIDEFAQKISAVRLSAGEKSGERVPVDLFYDFPELPVGNTRFLSLKKYGDLVLKSQTNSIEVNAEQRSTTRYIFAAGGASGSADINSGANILEPSFSDAYHQGELAAYNMQALRIANHRPHFAYFNILGENIQILAEKSFQIDEVYTEGDPSKLDFISYFSRDGKIEAVVASRRYQREVMLLKEAYHGRMVPDLQVLKSDRKAFYERLATNLSSDPTFCCYRDKIFRKRYDPYLKDLFWKDKSRIEEIVTEEFQNFKPVTSAPKPIAAPNKK